MRKPFLILNIILIVIQLNAQEQIVFQGTLKDSVNNIPIDYANIGIAHKNIGTISDDKGLFKLSIPKSFINDTITFSRIGYATKHLSINELLSQSNNTIVLKPKISTIREVNISSKKLKKKFRGNQTESHSIVLSCTSSPKKLGYEIGNVIKLRSQSLVKIKDFNFNIVSNSDDSTKFRLKIYDFSNNEIGKCILNENIYFIIHPNTTGPFKVDLSQYQIYSTHKIFISIETIKHYGAKKEANSMQKFINISSSLMGSKGYVRDISLGSWEKLPITFAPGFWVTTLEE